MLQAGLLSVNATKNAPTWDEVGHLGAGVSHWKLGEFSQYSVNPPLVRTLATSAVVLMNPELNWRDLKTNPRMRTEVRVGRRFIDANRKSFLDYFRIARWMCIPIVLLGSITVFSWARDLWGEPAGLLGALLFAFSPMILGHGSLITPDVAAASLGLFAFYQFRGWLRNSTWSRAIAMAAFFGLALLAKTTWLLCIALVPLIWICWRLHERRQEDGSWAVSRDLLQLSSSLVLVFVCFNAFYGFEGSFKRLGDFEFVSTRLAGREIKNRKNDFDNRFRDTLVGKIPVPLPANFVQGVDIQGHDFERAVRPPGWPSYLLGHRRVGGWWYYYLVGYAFKEPLPWLLLFVASLPLVLARKLPGLPLHELAALLIPAILILGIVSCQTNMSRHLRYALPALPFFIIWTAQYGKLLRRETLAPAAILIGLLSWQLGSVLYYAPHHLSYFNELAGGPEGGHRVLDNSNLDWGQDLLFLRDWITDHPEADGIRLAYFGCLAPTVLDIQYEIPTPYFAPPDTRHAELALGPEPGWYAVSANYVLGSTMNVPNGHGKFVYFGQSVFKYFSEFTPIDRAGYSIWIYHLEKDEVDAVRAKLCLPPFVER